ncbi:MAG: hypothetical protein C0596_15065 [Marinilabiliales bacterium]|nr:MAG: hypothetical protein C0596_15065 [Marinilabiliales bacterium]
MIASIRKFIVLAIVLLCTLSMFSQEEYLISQGGTITTCSGVLYDSGGADGNYDNNEDYTITIVSEDSETNIRLFFTEFNFESATFDNLSIYDGESIASPSIIAPSGSTNLLGQEIVASGNSITLVMHTDGSVTYPGFAASISCSYSCQDYEIDIVNTDPEITNLDSMWVDICHVESILMVGNAVFPNNDIVYHQSFENLYYIWQFVTEDYEEIYEGEGLFNPEVVLEQSGGYSVHLTTIDSNGCVEHFDDNLRIRTSLRPDFSEIIIDEGICLGEQLVLNGAFIQYTFNVNPVLGNSYPICFEDVVGVWQSTCFTFYSFAKNAIITSPEDIISVCMNMEHSYMGDLDI